MTLSRFFFIYIYMCVCVCVFPHGLHVRKRQSSAMSFEAQRSVCDAEQIISGRVVLPEIEGSVETNTSVGTSGFSVVF